MKAFFHLVLLALFTLFAGCKTPERAKFNDLKDLTFVSVGNTNLIAPQLLHGDTNLFTLGPGDQVEIEVLGQPETRAITTVGPDGKIYYHLLPGLDVWGMTLGETQKAIQEGLDQYFSDPQATVTLRVVGSRHIWLLGRLNRPGVYPMPAPISLLEAFALAGGTARGMPPASSDDLADLRHSFVMRNGEFLSVDFYRLFREGDTSQNIMLHPDDFVFVPSALSQEIHVLGAVAIPHSIPYTENVTLVSALTGANGPLQFDYLDRRSDRGLWQKDARLSHVTIVRGSLVDPQVAIVDFGEVMKGRAPNVRLEPGDIIYVPNSPYRVLKSYVNMIVNTFVGTVAANEGINAAGGAVNVGVSVPVTTQ